MVKTRFQTAIKASDPKQKTKPSSRKLKPLIEEKNYFIAKINTFSSFQVLEDIKKKLTPRQKNLFSKTCFGQFLNLRRIFFSGHLVHQILLRQLASEHTDKDECNPMIFEIAGKKCEFGLKDFALITGLDCGEFVKLTADEFENKLSNGIRDKFFRDKEKVWCKDVAEAFLSCESQSDDDVLKLAQLYLLEGFLLSKASRRPCHDFSIELVDNSGEFDKFPWGRYVYERTVVSMRRVIAWRAKKRQRTNSNSYYDTAYLLRGFPFALQYWAYECFPRIREKFGRRIGTAAPRMLNWADKKLQNFKMLDDVFKRGDFQVESGINPTKTEMGLDYFRYFLGEQKQKKMKNTDIVEEPPISEEEEQPATTEKVCKKKVVNCDKGRYARVELVNDSNSEIIASISKEIRQIAREEIRKMAREEIGKIAREEIRKIAREQMNGDMTQLLNKHRCKATELVPDVVHVEMDDDDDGVKGSVQRKRKRSMSESEDEIPCFTDDDDDDDEDYDDGDDDDDDDDDGDDDYGVKGSVQRKRKRSLSETEDEIPCFIDDDEDYDDSDDDDDDGDDGDDDYGVTGSVQRKRKRSMSETEDEIPCFTVDLFQQPHHDDKTEFDQWIKVGLKKRNKKMQYSNVANKLNPAFDFTIMECDKKDWFFSLNEPEAWLSSSHIDVALCYIRKKKNDHPEIFKHRSTTTDSLFYAILNSRYEEFKRNPKNFSWSREGYICKTLRGIEPCWSVPWVEADFVYIPVNVNKKHWVVAAVDLRKWRINIYDSFRNAKHNKEVESACLRIGEMLPWILNSEGYFGTRNGIKEVSLPLDVELVDGIPEQENRGDCGMFMLKFIEFLIQGMPLDGCNQEVISFFRNKMAVELYSYGKKRISN